MESSSNQHVLELKASNLKRASVKYMIFKSSFHHKRNLFNYFPHHHWQQVFNYIQYSKEFTSFCRTTKDYLIESSYYIIIHIIEQPPLKLNLPSTHSCYFTQNLLLRCFSLSCKISILARYMALHRRRIIKPPSTRK